MPIVQFTREQFEAALPTHRDKEPRLPLWKYEGLVGGEHTYSIAIPNIFCPLKIMIRSSIHVDGTSAAVGEDSIRCWLVVAETGEPMASKITKWTTRVAGWERRMTAILRLLYRVGMKLTRCPGCGQVRKAFIVKKDGENKGRLFQNCPLRCDRGFEWIEGIELTNAPIKSSGVAADMTVKENPVETAPLQPVPGERRDRE
jgi:hypothetical protein